MCLLISDLMSCFPTFYLVLTSFVYMIYLSEASTYHHAYFAVRIGKFKPVDVDECLFLDLHAFSLLLFSITRLFTNIYNLVDN